MHLMLQHGLAFVVEIVDRKDLTNAIALNATMFNMGTVFGPAIAGITYAAFGPAWCFAINGISYLAVIGALLLMRLEAAACPRTQSIDGVRIERRVQIYLLRKDCSCDCLEHGHHRIIWHQPANLASSLVG